MREVCLAHASCSVSNLKHFPEFRARDPSYTAGSNVAVRCGWSGEASWA